MDASVQRIKQPCEVCDAQSIGINFGVRTCMACKAFFRRNAVKLGKCDYICLKDGHCPIVRTKSSICKCCRLAKCFRVGMKKELILTESEKQERRLIIEKNRENLRLQQEKSLKLDIIQPISQYSYNLSPNDQQMLSNIFNTYELSCMEKRNTLIVKFPTSLHTRAHSYFNEYSKSHELFINYVKSIPDFNRILIDDRMRLIRNNFGFINNIHAPIIHPDVTSDLVVSMCNVFGLQLANQLFECIERIRIFRCDIILLKLLLIVLIFSSADLRNRHDTNMNQICTNTLLIFSVQNTYVELLWKYILSKSSNEMNAVKFFNKLIQFLVYSLNVHFLLDGYMNSLTDEIEQMTPLMKCMWPSPVANYR